MTDAAHSSARTSLIFNIATGAPEANPADPESPYYNVFQPICDANGRLWGYETLSRGREMPINFGELSPDQTAEMDRSAFINACHFLAFMRDNHLGHALHMTVNMDPRTLLQREVLGSFKTVAEEQGVETKSIVLEIVETPQPTVAALIENVEFLHSQGFRFFLDDVGTNYPQDIERLWYLQGLIAGYKLDARFWATGEEQQSQLLAFFPQDMLCVLEGIEENKQLKRFQELAVKRQLNILGQGFHPRLGKGEAMLDHILRHLCEAQNPLQEKPQHPLVARAANVA